MMWPDVVTWIAALTEGTDLTIAARVLGCHLAARWADWSTGAGIWCAVSDLSCRTGLSPRAVERALGELDDGAWIVVGPSGGPVHYRLNLSRALGEPSRLGELELDDGAPAPGGE